MIKKYYVAPLLITGLVLAGCNPLNNRTANATPTPRPVVMTTEPTASAAIRVLPEGWQWLTNDMSQFSIGYPGDWFAYLPETETGETAIYSYDVTTMAGSDGVPLTELKVAIMHYDPSRATSYEPPVESSMTSSEDITINGETLTKKTFDTSFGSIEQVEINRNDHLYVISAYPANSERIDIFNQMLTTFTTE